MPRRWPARRPATPGRSRPPPAGEPSAWPRDRRPPRRDGGAPRRTSARRSAGRSRRSAGEREAALQSAATTAVAGVQAAAAQGQAGRRGPGRGRSGAGRGRADRDRRRPGTGWGRPARWPSPGRPGRAPPRRPTAGPGARRRAARTDGFMEPSRRPVPRPVAATAAVRRLAGAEPAAPAEAGAGPDDRRAPRPADRGRRGRRGSAAAPPARVGDSSTAGAVAVPAELEGPLAGLAGAGGCAGRGRRSAGPSAAVSRRPARHAHREPGGGRRGGRRRGGPGRGLARRGRGRPPSRASLRPCGRTASRRRRTRPAGAQEPPPPRLPFGTGGRAARRDLRRSRAGRRRIAPWNRGAPSGSSRCGAGPAACRAGRPRRPPARGEDGRVPTTRRAPLGTDQRRRHQEREMVYAVQRRMLEERERMGGLGGLIR